jgi:hypothetical protein
MNSRQTAPAPRGRRPLRHLTFATIDTTRSSQELRAFATMLLTHGRSFGRFDGRCALRPASRRTSQSFQAWRSRRHPDIESGCGSPVLTQSRRKRSHTHPRATALVANFHQAPSSTARSECPSRYGECYDVLRLRCRALRRRRWRSMIGALAMGHRRSY